MNGKVHKYGISFIIAFATLRPNSDLPVANCEGTVLPNKNIVHVTGDFVTQ